MIPWDEIEDKYADLFPSKTGTVAKPLRMALGSLLIQKEFGFSDRVLVEQLQEANRIFSISSGSPVTRWRSHLYHLSWSNSESA